VDVPDGSRASRKILEATDWRAFENYDDIEKGWPPADSGTKLRGLASDDLRLVEAGLWHLWHSLREDDPNVHPAAAPAARYICALVTEPLVDDLLKLNLDGSRRPLRAHLLHWLAALADEVSDARVHEFIELTGFSPIDHSPQWQEVRQLRPQMFAAAATFFDDPDLIVRRAALTAAVVLVQSGEPAAHRERIATSIRHFLAVCTGTLDSRWATTALEELAGEPEHP
jgi:hypothetical protein